MAVIWALTNYDTKTATPLSREEILFHAARTVRYVHEHGTFCPFTDGN